MLKIIKRIANLMFSAVFGKNKNVKEIQLYRREDLVKKRKGINKKFPKVTFNIPVRNEENSIEKCIKSILDDSYKNKEMVIVDDKSTDKTLQIIRAIQRKSKVPIKIVENEKRLGCALTRINGASVSTGDFIVFFDAHSVICTKDYVKNFLKYFENPEIAAVKGGAVWEPYYYTDFVMSYAGGIRPMREAYEFLNSAFSMHRKESFDEVGGFNELIVWGSDVDITLKYLEKGWKICFDSKIKIKTDHSITPNRWIDFIKKQYLYGTGVSYMLPRHFKELFRRKLEFRIILGGLVNLSSALIAIFNSRLFWLPFVAILIFRAHSFAIAVRYRSPVKYIIGIPLILTLSEISYTLGFIRGLPRRIRNLPSVNYS